MRNSSSNALNKNRRNQKSINPPIPLAVHPDVDKAIRALEKKQEKNLLKEHEEQELEEGPGGAGAGDGGSLDHPQQHYDQQQSHHQHHQQHHHHQQQQQQQQKHASKQEKMSKHGREEPEGIASPRHGGSPPHSECLVIVNCYYLE